MKCDVAAMAEYAATQTTASGVVLGLSISSAISAAGSEHLISQAFLFRKPPERESWRTRRNRVRRNQTIHLYSRFRALGMIEQLPDVVLLDTTNVCNARCPFCPLFDGEWQIDRSIRPAAIMNRISTKIFSRKSAGGPFVLPPSFHRQTPKFWNIRSLPSGSQR